MLRPEADAPVSAKQLLHALVNTGAAQIMVLPNGYVAAEELVAGCTAAIGWGIDVVPVPAGSMVQGLAALAVHDAERQAVDDGYTMARAAAGARHGSVRVATEEALTWAGTCKPGDGLAIAGDEVLIVGSDVTAAAAGLIDLLLAAGGELVTVLTGAGVDGSVGEALQDHVAPPASRHRVGDLSHRPPRRCVADRGGVAVAALTDRLDYVLGKKAAGPLEEHFGIRTVNDLLRHYPRKYSDGMTVLGEGEELEEGEHVTFVDVIAKAEVKWTNRPPKREYLRRHPRRSTAQGDGDVLQREVSQEGLGTEGTRLMLSGEVGYFKGTMQLTHPAFLVLESPSGRQFGTKSLKTIAATSGATGDDLLSVFERDFFPIYPANKKVQSWDIYACVRQVLDVLDPDR